MAFPGVKKKSKRKNAVPAGHYSSTLVGVRNADGYSENEAVVVRYELKNDRGDIFAFEELFLNDLDNPRTEKFDSYLSENGVVLNSFEDLIGLEEELTLEKQVRSGCSYMNIVKRDFIKWG